MSEDLIGSTGVIFQDILPGKAGEVTVRRRGTDEQMFARAVPGSDAIPTGTKVLITDLLDSNTVTVQPL